MIYLVLWWFTLIIFVTWFAGRRGRLSPMLLAYIAGLSIIHVPGAVNFLGPADMISGELETQIGFQATLIGMTVMLIGALVSRTPIKQLESGTGAINQQMAARVAALSNMSHHSLGVMMIVIGVFAYFIALPVASMVPSLSSLVAPMGGLLIVGIFLLVYDAALRSDWRQLGLLLVCLPLLPLSTLLLGGFLGYGVIWLICIFAAVYCFWPRRWMFLLAAPIIAYLGLSLGTAYLLERGEIREVIWGQQAALGERFESVLAISERFDLYDVTDPDHMQMTDARMNQNFLVGKGILGHQDGFNELYYGATVPLWSLIPRVVWPDKPAVGGGRDWVSDFTGIYFDEDTSIGVGQPLEFFMNFGWAGLIIGFLIFGFILARLDQMLMRGLREQNIFAILFGGLVGMALMQPGGNLLELMVTSVGAVVCAIGTAFVLEYYVRGRRARDADRRSGGEPARAFDRLARRR